MVELVAKSPCDKLLPLQLGAMKLVEETPIALTSIMPFNGQRAAVCAALGMALPKVNQTTTQGPASLTWFAQNQYLLVGAPLPGDLAGLAAVTDQSDGWAVVTLTGPGVADVLARLVPVDLRVAVFPVGATVRSELMHMPASLTRVGPEAIRIMVFRSMSATLVHDLKTAMEAVVARG